MTASHGPCARCKREVALEYRYPRGRKWAKAYLLIPVPFIPVLPIMASDYVVMLPLLMWYLLGIGPVLAIVKDKPVCRECGAFVSLPGRGQAQAALPP